MYACIGENKSIPEFSFPDILIGRLSVDNMTELDVIADKIITYERTPITGKWRQEILLCGWPIAEFIIDEYIELSGYNTTEVFTDHESNNDTLAVIDEIKKRKKIGWVFRALIVVVIVFVVSGTDADDSLRTVGIISLLLRFLFIELQ